MLVTEPGRALNAADVEPVLTAPVVAEIAIDPAVARTIDAGLLAARLPRALACSLAALTLGDEWPHVSDRLTTITVEASDHHDHAATVWEPSLTRVYIVRGYAPPLLVAAAYDMYAAVDLIVDVLTERFPVTVDAVTVVSTADACDLVTGDHVARIRVAYGLSTHQRASVIRRRCTPGGGCPFGLTFVQTLELAMSGGSAGARPRTCRRTSARDMLVSPFST